MSSECVPLKIQNVHMHVYGYKKKKKMNSVFPKLYDYRTVLFSSAY